MYSKRVSGVQPSATLAITSKAKAMLRDGEDVVVLAAGEPDFDTPVIIKEKAKKAIDEGFTKYTPAGGIVSLKETICRKLFDENGLEYTADNIVISCGAKHSLYNIMQAICDPGDEVLIISPYWVSYPEMARLAGAVPRIVPAYRENGFKAKIEDIAKNINPGTRSLIINSPSNPAGVVYDKKELAAISDLCLEKGVRVISDEIYEKILYDGKKHVSTASLSDDARENTILVNGVSKSFSMTGWRIGYIAAEEGLIKKITILQSHSTSNPCSISQAAAECALTGDLSGILEKNRSEFEGRRDLVMDLLKGAEKLDPFKPEGAFYLFCDISGTGMDSVTFARKLLEEKKVAIIPGGPFGEDGYIRISFATSREMIREGIGRIVEWVDGQVF